MSDETKKELATNRLLDLLRAQEKPEAAGIEKKDKRVGPLEPETLQENLLTDQKTKQKPEPDKDPELFDATLIENTTDYQPHKLTSSVVKNGLRKLDNRSHQISFFTEGKSVYVMAVNHSGEKPIVTDYAKYVLPFTDGDIVINDTETMKKHILDHTRFQTNKNTFISYTSSDLVTHTRGLVTSGLKPKELTEMVNWTAKKTLSVDIENAIIDYEVLQPNSDDKQYVTIGVTDPKGYRSDLTMFDERSLTVRYIAPIPYLLWKMYKETHPEKQDHCDIIIHIGQKSTIIVLVDQSRIYHSRDIPIGVNDFTDALKHRIVEGTDTIKVDQETAGKILKDYGFPAHGNGWVKGLNIRLSKLSVFLRPVIEKLTGTITQSLTYFKKENPKISWNRLLFTGIGASLPNIMNVLSENLDVPAHILNPNRTHSFGHDSDAVIKEEEYPEFTINYALLMNEGNPVNLIEADRKKDFLYRFRLKMVYGTAAMLLPIILGLSGISYFNLKSLENDLQETKSAWTEISKGTGVFFEKADQIDMWESYEKMMKNDRTLSGNQIELLKMLSTTIPDDMMLTRVEFDHVKPEKNSDEKTLSQQRLAISGFVQSHASIADIQLTNLVMKLESLNMFKKVMSETEDTRGTENRLFFTMRMIY